MIANQKYMLIDAISGEICGEINVGDKIIPKPICDAFDATLRDERIIPLNNGKPYMKLYRQTFELLAHEKLSSVDWNIVCLLVAKTHRKSGLIAHRNNRPITTESLAIKLGIHPKTVEASLRRLCDSGIIARSKTAGQFRFFCNPYIFMDGRYINRTLYQMFRRTKFAQAEH